MSSLPGPIFARRLRDERGRAGVSQAALADHLTATLYHRVDASAISRMEKGDRPARLDEAVVIAEKLGVPLATLLRDRDAIDERIDELRSQLSEYVWRLDQAKGEFESAQASIDATERAIAELMASRGE
jgi:transcriptional regulator with XRE-family HTH domain